MTTARRKQQKPKWRSLDNAAGAALSYALEARLGYALPVGMDEMLNLLTTAAREGALTTDRKLTRRAERALDSKGKWGAFLSCVDVSELRPLFEAAIASIFLRPHEKRAFILAANLDVERADLIEIEIEWRWRDLGRCVTLPEFEQFDRLWRNGDYQSCCRVAAKVRQSVGTTRRLRDALRVYVNQVVATAQLANSGVLRFDYAVVDEVESNGKCHQVDELLATLSDCREEAPNSMVFDVPMVANTLGEVARWAGCQRPTYQIRQAALCVSVELFDAVGAALDADRIGFAASLVGDDR